MYSLNDKNDKLAALKKVADEIFVPAATVKLALLGKVWGCNAQTSRITHHTHHTSHITRCGVTTLCTRAARRASSPTLWRTRRRPCGTAACWQQVSMRCARHGARAADVPTAGLTTEVLVALPATTVIAIDDLRQPQVRPHKVAKNTQNP
jgi:hypothetical protein